MKNPQQGVLPITKQHFRNLNSGRRSDESRHGGADGALLDTRQQVAAAARAAAFLVDTQSSGKAPTFIGEHKGWPV